MTLLFRSRAATRAISYQGLWASGGSVDLLGNSVEGALRLVPLFAAHRLLIDQFASTPLHAYTTGADGTRERLRVQPRMSSEPSPTRMAYSWKAQCIASLLSTGNAYGYKVEPQTNNATCEWLDPAMVSVDESGPLPIYTYMGRELDRSEVLHIAWITQPGKWKGLSPLAAFKVAFETGQAAQTSARDWFVNGAIPSGHLKNTAKTLNETEATELRKRYKSAVSGRDVLVTGADWQYTTIGIPADQARFIEMIRLTATQVAAIYGVPAERIGGDTGKSLTYSTLEQDQLMFLSNSLRPWYANVEEALSTLMPANTYVRFNADVHVRTDITTRMQAYEVAQRAGVLTNDEARALEDRPPLTTAQKDLWMSLWRNGNQQTSTVREAERGA